MNTCDSYIDTFTQEYEDKEGNISYVTRKVCRHNDVAYKKALNLNYMEKPCTGLQPVIVKPPLVAPEGSNGIVFLTCKEMIDYEGLADSESVLDFIEDGD